MYRLSCKAHSYEWGSSNEGCAAARFSRKHGQAQPPYAEFWTGTHPGGQSVLESTGAPLSSVAGQVPFVLKFLSVSKSLSIQVHPDAALAFQLHESNPSMYNDPNPKPELAVALTQTSLLYGFRDDWMDVRRHYKELPCHHGSLKELVEYLLTGYDILSVYKRILDRVGFNPRNKTDELFVMLCEQHPNDTGALVAVFMNHVTLCRGESVSIGPNVPHAYLSGDIVECTSLSDNVIRVGLTKKAKDINTVLGCVSYDTLPPLVSDPDEKGTYVSGFKDFDITHVRLAQDEQRVFGCSSPSIIAVEHGSGYVELEDDYGYLADAGMVYYVPAGVYFDVYNMSDSLSIWAASSPGSVTLS